MALWERVRGLLRSNDELASADRHRRNMLFSIFPVNGICKYFISILVKDPID